MTLLECLKIELRHFVILAAALSCVYLISMYFGVRQPLTPFTIILCAVTFILSATLARYYWQADESVF